jgi:dTDP-4-amino-4,6-dideoxygalactose transaminase
VKNSSSPFRIPFIRPRPPKLSTLQKQLEQLEESGIFTNYGPLNTEFEKTLTDSIFAGQGGCVTVNNATIGLMVAIKEAAVVGAEKKFALMPSFTFAATAHAALWAGLTPLLCDIDVETWNLDQDAEAELFKKYEGQIACVVPYASFGNGLDLDHYSKLAKEQNVGLVVDAAASLGSLDHIGRGFGTGFSHPVVYSMHATKTFATAEAGVIHCGDHERLSRLRSMGNFGFGRSREATMPGLNSKLSEVGALLALSKLKSFDDVVLYRERLAGAYREGLPGFGFQKLIGRRTAYQFMPVLLPRDLKVSRSEIMAQLTASGIGAGHYFSPHLAEHSYFKEVCRVGDLGNTNEIAGRSLSLPIADEMSFKEVKQVCDVLLNCVSH